MWGRGTIDDKNCVLALLGALETVAARAGRPPLRTLVVALGHDEEIGGHEARARARRVGRMLRVGCLLQWHLQH